MAKINGGAAILLISLLGFVSYHNSFRAPFTFDDTVRIVENPDIRKLSNLKTRLFYPYENRYQDLPRNVPYQPVAYLTYTLNYHFGGLNPFGYHLFNLLLHIVNSFLLFLLAKKIIFCLYRKEASLFPLVLALFFVSHPINSSAVTYVQKRVDLLATLFYFLSLLSFSSGLEKRKKSYLFLAVLSYVFAIFSKQMALTLPFIILIFHYIILTDFDKDKILEKKYIHLAFWAVLLFYLCLRKFFLGWIGDVEMKTYWNRWDYLVVQPSVLWNYIRLMIIPRGLCIDHYLAPVNISDVKFWGSLAAIIAFFGLVFKTLKTGNNKTAFRIFLFCTLFFFVSLSPVSSLFPTVRPMAEHRLYLPWFGFFFLTLFSFSSIFKIDVSDDEMVSRSRPFIFLLFCVLLFSFLTVRRNNIFKDPVRLWEEALSKYPSNYRAYNNLGIIYHGRQEYSKALEAYNNALFHKNDFYESYYNLGLLHYNRAEYEKAMLNYEKALLIEPDNDKIHNNIGMVFYEKNEYEKAVSYYQRAIEINPKNADVYNNLGLVYFKQGRLADSLKAYALAFELNPGNSIIRENTETIENAEKNEINAPRLAKNPKAVFLPVDIDNAKMYYNLGNLYLAQKDYKKALEEYQKALVIYPEYTEVYNNRGNLHFLMGNHLTAENDFRQSIKINPKNAEAHNNLGNLYFSEKKFPEAEQAFTKTLEINPNLAEAYNNLGRVYFEQKEYGQAIKEFRKAMKLKQGYIKTQYNLANTFFSMGDYENAIKEYLEVIKLSPAHINSHYDLTEIYYIRKEYDKCLEILQKLLTLKPGDKEIQSKINTVLELSR